MGTTVFIPCGYMFVATAVDFEEGQTFTDTHGLIWVNPVWSASSKSSAGAAAMTAVSGFVGKSRKNNLKMFSEDKPIFESFFE